jgi:hypothetical protein
MVLDISQGEFVTGGKDDCAGADNEGGNLKEIRKGLIARGDALNMNSLSAKWGDRGETWGVID